MSKEKHTIAKIRDCLDREGLLSQIRPDIQRTTLSEEYFDKLVADLGLGECNERKTVTSDRKRH